MSELIRLLRLLSWKVRLAVKKALVVLLGKRTKIIRDRTFTCIIYRVVFLRKPDFDQPKTFNEWICFRKIRIGDEDKWRYTDKYEVRDFVRQSIGNKYLIKCYGVYDSFDSMNFDEFPSAFVMKCTHGSSYNVIIKDKAKQPISKYKKRFQKWLGKNYYFEGRERNYIRIRPRIMIEELLDPKEVFDEYKLFCFRGGVKFVQLNRVVGGVRYSNMYDEQWNYLKVEYGYPNFQGEELRKNLETISDLANRLSQPFDFVRVDLYDVDGRIFFGELTFNPGGGFVPFFPKKYDEILGRFFTWQI